MALITSECVPSTGVTTGRLHMEIVWKPEVAILSTVLLTVFLTVLSLSFHYLFTVLFTGL